MDETVKDVDEKALNGTVLYKDGPISSITTRVVEEEEGLALIREVMEEPRGVIPVVMTVVLRTPLSMIHINLKFGEDSEAETPDPAQG